MWRVQSSLALLLPLILFTPKPAVAQGTRAASIVEVQAGYAGFIDEVWINRAVIGGAVRDFVTSRVAVGPEFLYLHAGGSEHDWTLTGNVSFDMVRDTKTRRFTPYAVAGGGIVSQTQAVGTGPFTSREGTFSGGVGARLRLGRRVFLAPEFRIGFEPTMRIGVTIGWLPGRS